MIAEEIRSTTESSQKQIPETVENQTQLPRLEYIDPEVVKNLERTLTLNAAQGVITGKSEDLAASISSEDNEQVLQEARKTLGDLWFKIEGMSKDDPKYGKLSYDLGEAINKLRDEKVDISKLVKEKPQLIAQAKERQAWAKDYRSQEGGKRLQEMATASDGFFGKIHDLVRAINTEARKIMRNNPNETSGQLLAETVSIIAKRKLQEAQSSNNNDTLNRTVGYSSIERVLSNLASDFKRKYGVGMLDVNQNPGVKNYLHNIADPKNTRYLDEEQRAVLPMLINEIRNLI